MLSAGRTWGSWWVGWGLFREGPQRPYPERGLELLHGQISNYIWFHHGRSTKANGTQSPPITLRLQISGFSSGVAMRRASDRCQTAFCKNPDQLPRRREIWKQPNGSGEEKNRWEIVPWSNLLGKYEGLRNQVWSQWLWVNISLLTIPIYKVSNRGKSVLSVQECSAVFPWSVCKPKVVLIF